MAEDRKEEVPVPGRYSDQLWPHRQGDGTDLLLEVEVPNITGSWSVLTEVDFMMPHPSGGYLHFRDQFRDAAGTQLVTYRDPLTGLDTGQSARAAIESQAAQFGWPLIGLYISGIGLVPHCAINRLDFPSQTGSPEARAEKLQNALDLALESIYKREQYVDDPTDPDYGKTIDVRNFWVNTHVFSYRRDGLYSPGADFKFRVGNKPPRSNWWARG